MKNQKAKRKKKNKDTQIYAEKEDFKDKGKAMY